MMSFYDLIQEESVVLNFTASYWCAKLHSFLLYYTIEKPYKHEILSIK